MVDITPKKDGGILKEIITPGEGDDTPSAGCSVSCHYHGMLEDGTVFDSSVERGEPFEFNLGKGAVIKAWDIGVATMKKGEKSKFTCRADYAYGKNGSPPKIPGDATLIFEVTLLSWTEEDLSKEKDRGILRSILTPGEGWTHPNEYALCNVCLKGTYNEKVFDEREVSFHVGEGDEIDIPPGIEKALESMNKGEKSRITLSPKHGFPEGHEKFGIPAGAKIQYEITLKSFEKSKESWELDNAEKIQQAKMFKEKATERFQAADYHLAAKYYKKAVEYVDSDVGFNEDENAQRKAVLLALKLNLGMAYLKQDNHVEARKQCDEALQLDPNNIKGHFRRGQAYLAMNEPEQARVDFAKVLELEPSNKAASTQLAICVQKSKELRAKEKQIYANMFEKFAQKDREDTYRFGWWDDKQKSPIITEREDECKQDVEEMRREKRKQLEHLKKIAEAKRKQREELEKQQKDLNLDKEENSEQVPEKQGEGNSEELGGVGCDEHSGGMGGGGEGKPSD